MSIENPLISIIIPVYNLEDYILDCLISIKNNSSENYEIIIVNDGSTDQSLEKISNFITQNKKIKLKLISQKNLGVSSARNNGLKISNGKYILFLDGDDIVTPDLFSTIEYINQKEIDNELIYWKYKNIDENERNKINYYISNEIQHQIYSKEKFLKKYVKNKKINLWIGSIVFLKEFIIKNNICFTENCKVGEDKEFIHKAIIICKNFIYINKILSYYVQRESSVSNTYSLNKFDAIYAEERVFDFIMNKIKKPYKIYGNYFLREFSFIHFTNQLSIIKRNTKKNISQIFIEINDYYPQLINKYEKIWKNNSTNNVFFTIKVFLFFSFPDLYINLLNLRYYKNEK